MDAGGFCVNDSSACTAIAGRENGDIPRKQSETIEGAFQAADVTGHDMGVDLGGLYIRVAEQFLKDADIYPVFQHMRGKTVAQRVATNPLVDSGLLHSPLYRFLQNGLENMVTHFLAGTRIE